MYWNINFISEENYRNHVKKYFEQILKSSSAYNTETLNKNIIDPIKLTFSYFATGQDKAEIINSEISRQYDKTINNHIGYFHQNLFAFIEGWSVPKGGFDLENEERHIYVEMKNKHNTMNSVSSQKTYINMQQKILEDDQATCMLVEIIARKSADEPWAITIDNKSSRHDKIRRVSIDRFYELVTGDKHAFKKIIEWFPITLKSLVKDKETKIPENIIISELESGQSFFEGVYKLAFKSYTGFDNLEFVGCKELGADFKITPKDKYY